MTDESNGDVVQVQCLDQHMQIMSHIATIKMKKKDYIMEHFFIYLPDEGTPLEFLAFPWPWPFDPYSLPRSQTNLMSQGCH